MMRDYISSCIVFVIFVGSFLEVQPKLMKFTKVECKAYDKTFAEFEQCQLKVIGRDKIALQLHINLYQKVKDNLIINAELFRKSHDYRPFMYNDTMDFCGFLRSPSRFLFWKILLQGVTPYTNINHSCPYENDVIVRDLVLEDNMLKSLPFPSNDYMIQIKALTQNTLRTEVKVYVTIKE